MPVHAITIKRQPENKSRRENAPFPDRCPKPGCSYHNPVNIPKGRKQWFLWRGFSETERHGQVQQYLCQGCGSFFSETTLIISYCEKRDVNYAGILKAALSAESLKKSAVLLGVHPDTLIHRGCKLGWWFIAELGRQRGLDFEYWRVLWFMRDAVKSGLRGWGLLRALFEVLGEIFNIHNIPMQTLLPNTEIPRSFLSQLPSETLKSIRRLCCEWRYTVCPGLYLYPRYMLE